MASTRITPERPKAIPARAPIAGVPGDFDVTRPFTRAQAIAAGVEPRVLRTKEFRQVFRGVYVASNVEDSPVLRTLAALALLPDTAFASHTDAARLMELPVPDVPLTHVTVLRQEERRSRHGLKVHVSSRPQVVTLPDGTRTSHPFRLFIELAGILSLVDLVVVGDEMCRRFDLDPARLVQACEESSDNHAVAARRAASYVRANVDSPMETRLRMLIVLAGLPEPVVNLELRADGGIVCLRFDLAYPDVRLVVEYDGQHHLTDRKQSNRDLERRELIDDLEWHIVVVRAEGIYASPDRTLDRIRHKLVRLGHPGVPRRLAQDWRPYFPGRPGRSDYAR